MLPKIKGMDVLKMLRANDSFKSMPIVVFSNASQPGLVEDAWAAGATMVMSKMNTSPKHMVETVLSALAKSNAALSEDSAATMKNVAGPPAAGGNGRILLVENNPESRAMVSHLLTRVGYQIVNAEGQEHAALLSEVTGFDLVVANRVLCKTAQSLCEQVRRKNPNLPVVVYAMNAVAEEIQEAMCHGISKFLTTPEQLLDIAQVSASLVGRDQSQIALAQP
jgi:CheY-like chemotaxis protein